MREYYDRENRRLVYIGKSATPDYWDSHWICTDRKFRESLKRSKNNRFVLETLKKYIPDKKGQVLEGGCGRSQIVYCMHVHGYKAIGVDFAQKTIEQVKNAIPELDVRIGDVRDLPFPDDYFRGYWSLGVIEHFWDGYGVILKEMRRVLTNGGYVFLTFPYMSPLRRLKVKFRLYEEFKGNRPEDFYQFALDLKTVIKDFETIGFKLLNKKSMSGLKGFKDEINISRPLLQRLFDYQGENLWIRGFRFALDKLLTAFCVGHMVFLVFKNIKHTQ